MLATSILGLLCNLVMVKILHSDENFKHEGCSHGHGSSHDHHHEENGSPVKPVLHVNGGSQEDLDHPMNDSPTSSKPHLSGLEEDGAPIHVCSGDHHHHHHHEEEQEFSNSTLPFEPASKNLNIEAAYVHILGDIILSVGVIIAASIIYFFTEKGAPWNYYHLVDPLCTYLFSVLVVMTTFRITKKSIIILMDGCLDESLVK